MPTTTSKNLKTSKNTKKLQKKFDPLHEVIYNRKPHQWLVILRAKLTDKKITPKDLEAPKVISEESVQRILNNEHASNRRIDTWRGLIHRLYAKKVFESSTEILDWLLIDPVFPDRQLCTKLAINITAAKNIKFSDIKDPIEYAKNRGWWVRYPKIPDTRHYLSRNQVEQDVLHSIQSVNFLQITPVYHAVICHGVAGCGKTTLIQYLCTQKKIRNIFMDGIFWVGDTIQTGREALISLGDQINTDQTNYLFHSPVLVETWEKWILEKDRRALVIIDNSDIEVLKTVLRTNTKRMQFIILTRDHHVAFRAASPFFQRDGIGFEQIGSLDLEKAIIDWVQKNTSNEALPSSVRNNISESTQEILEWCDRASFLPEAVRFILEATLQKAWGYSNILLTPETIGIKELSLRILENTPISEIVLIEKLLKKVEYHWFTFDQAQKIIPKVKDLKVLLHAWKLQGFLLSHVSGPNEKEKYQFLPILVEFSDLAKKHQETIQEWIFIHSKKRLRVNLYEIAPMNDASEKVLV
jgi:hypothetical protein